MLNSQSLMKRRLIACNTLEAYLNYGNTRDQFFQMAYRVFVYFENSQIFHLFYDYSYFYDNIARPLVQCAIYK